MCVGGGVVGRGWAAEGEACSGEAETEGAFVSAQAGEAGAARSSKHPVRSGGGGGQVGEGLLGGQCSPPPPPRPMEWWRG